MGEYTDALARLTSAQKPAYGAPAYSRFINRPVGRRIAAASFAAGLTPNQVTAISATLSAIGIVLIALAPVSVITGVVAAILFALGYAFDSADGQLARLTGTGGPAGEWLDHVVDMAKTVLFHGAIIFSLIFHQVSVPTWLFAVIIGYAAVSTTAFFAWLLVDLLQRVGGKKDAPAQPDQRAPVIRSLLRLPSDYGLLCWTLVLWGTVLFWWVYVLLFVANFLILVLALPVWFRQARAITTPSG